MGNLIIKSKKANTAGNQIAVFVICAIIFIVGFYVLTISDVDPNRNPVGFFIPVMMIGLGIGYPILMLILLRTTNKTFVCVNSDSVTGVSVINQFQVASFEVKYDQILNVDVIKNSVVIHTTYGKYSCTASNGEEIRNAILQIKEQNK